MTRAEAEARVHALIERVAESDPDTADLAIDVLLRLAHKK